VAYEDGRAGARVQERLGRWTGGQTGKPTAQIEPKRAILARSRLLFRCMLFNRSLYLDGNNLQCEGAINLIRPFAEQAVIDAELEAEAAAAAAAAAVADDNDDLTEKRGQGQEQGEGQGE